MSEKIITEATEAIAEELMLTPAEEAAQRDQMAVKAFAEHVEMVRTHGDPLKTVPRLNANSIAQASPSIATIPALIEAGANPFAAVVVGGLLTTAAVAGRMTAPYIGAKRRFDERHGDIAQTLLDERYELYRFPKRKDRQDKSVTPEHIAMRYYGPAIEEDTVFKKEELIKRFGRMVDLAAANDVRTIILPEAYTRIVGLPANVAATTMQELLNQRKVYVSGSLAGQKVYVARTHDWESSKPEAERHPDTTEIEDRLAGLVDGLRKVSPDHPLVRTYDRHKLHPESMQKHLIRGIYEDVERANVDAQVTHSRFFDEAGYLNIQRKATPLRAQPAKDGRELLYVTPEGRVMDRVALAEAFKLDGEEALSALANHPEMMPSAARLVLPLLMLQELKQVAETELPVSKIAADTEVKNEEDSVKIGRGFTVQEGFRELTTFTKDIDNLSTKRTTHVAMLLGNVSMLLALVSGLVLSSAENNRYDDALSNARHQLAVAQHKDPADIDSSAVESAVTKNSPDLKAWDGVVHLASRLGGGAQTVTAPSDGLSGSIETSDGGSGVGNVDPNNPNVVKWKLRPIGNMATNGYWATSGSDSLQYLGGANSTKQIEWAPDLTIDEAWHLLPINDLGLSSGIQVSGTVTPDEVDSTGRLITIPILQGTSPIAAEIGGQPLAESVTKNGNIVFRSQHPALGEQLTYTLAADYNPQDQPHAVESIDVNEPDGLETIGGDPLAAAKGSIMKDVPALALSHGPVSQATMQKATEEYLQWSFKYALDPISPTKESEEASLADFVDDVFSGKEANCNVASTIEALAAEHSSDKDGSTIGLNIVDGDLVGDDATKITTHDAHQWNDDASGNIVDSTPEEFASKQDAAYFNQPAETAGSVSVPAELPLKPIGEALALLALADAGYKGRRRINAAYRTYKKQRSERARQRVANLDSEVVAEAAAVINAVKWDSEQRIGLARQNAQRPTVIGSAPLSLLQQSYMHDSDTTTQLKTVRKSGGLSREDLRALKATERVVGLVRKAQ